MNLVVVVVASLKTLMLMIKNPLKWANKLLQTLRLYHGNLFRCDFENVEIVPLFINMIYC